jgi:single-strand DNA-binding protein
LIRRTTAFSSPQPFRASKKGIDMASSMNRVFLMGNVTRDPELRYISNGSAVTEIGLAINDRRKSSSGEWIEETTFVDITLWGRTAEIAGEYVTKGSPLLVEGRLKLDSWEKDGKKNSKLRVVGDRMHLIGSRGGNRPEGSQVGSRNQGGTGDNNQSQADQSAGYDTGGGFGAANAAGGAEDDIPF